MNRDDLLNGIGEARADFVWDTQQVRAGILPAKTGKIPAGKVILAAAILAVSLLLVGCTVAYVQGWFGDFFAQESGSPLSEGQLAFLEDNEQTINQSQTMGGWTVELRSVISDGTQGYILLGVTAPEGTDLGTVQKNGVVMSHVKTGNAMLHSKEDLLTLPDGVSGSYSMSFEEDGDGLPHTANYEILLSPDLHECSVDPFGKDVSYRIAMEDIYRETVNEEVWDGFSQIVTFEKAWTDELLAEGVWEFTFSFALDPKDVIRQELLTEPFTTVALSHYQYGEDNFADAAWFLEEHTVTSFVLKPLTAVVTYRPTRCQEGTGRFVWGNNWNCYAVMKDGRKIQLHHGFGGGPDTYYLSASAPLVLEEVDHIQLADGTEISMDGQVKTPQWRENSLPPAPETLIPGQSRREEIAAYYSTLPSELGIHVYHDDFDGDGHADAAIWQDGCYIALCCMDEEGVLTELISFEPSLTVEELAERYGGDIPDRITFHQILKPIETFWYY